MKSQFKIIFSLHFFLLPELDTITKRHYLQSDEPSQFAKSAENERIYAQVGTLEASRQLPNNQIFFQNQIDTMGKIPRKILEKALKLLDKIFIFSREIAQIVNLYLVFFVNITNKNF